MTDVGAVRHTLGRRRPGLHQNCRRLKLRRETWLAGSVELRAYRSGIADRTEPYAALQASHWYASHPLSMPIPTPSFSRVVRARRWWKATS